jgi:hypothetical protein
MTFRRATAEQGSTRLRGWTAFALLLMAAGACGGDGSAPAGEKEAAPAAMAPPPVDEPWEVVRPRVEQYADSADRLLRPIPNLSGAELATLRRDVNARQIASARAFGHRVVDGVEPLLESGRLVPLAESTPLWVVRELTYSVPYVTRDTHAMLEEIGERFHARLDSLGVPRYRLDITSVLRTPDKQARLRRSNPNASQIESAHEFGTTLDIAYRRFAAPAGHPGAGVRAPELRQLADSMLIDAGRLRAAELQAILGRVLLEMRSEGKLLVIMERAQTVYHITVAQRFEGALAED